MAGLLRKQGLAGFETPTLACWLTILGLARHGAAFDVGANIGPYGWLAATFTERRVVAFEPVPGLAKAIREVSVPNDLQIRVEEIALSNDDGQANLFLSDATDSSHSLIAGFRPSSETIQVPTVRLDSYLARTGIVPHVLKIDTETSEPEVLEGALDMLATVRPWLILEVLAGRTEERLSRVMAPFDYSWYPIADQPASGAQEFIVGDPTHRDTNWLFAPTRPGRSFWLEMDRWKRDLALSRASDLPSGPRA